MRLRRYGRPLDDLARDIERHFPLGRNELVETAPVLCYTYGGTVLAGTTAGARACNMDSTPKVIGTLANQVVELWTPSTDFDVPPDGMKTQYLHELNYACNAAGPAQTFNWGPWEMLTSAGGAGGFTETASGSFISALTVTRVNPPNNGRERLSSGWIDQPFVIGTVHYMAGVFVGGTTGASSAIRWRGRLYRRFVRQ